MLTNRHSPRNVRVILAKGLPTTPRPKDFEVMFWDLKSVRPLRGDGSAQGLDPIPAGGELWEVVGRPYVTQTLKVEPPRSYWAVGNSSSLWKGKASTVEDAFEDWKKRNDRARYTYEELKRIK